MRVLRDDGVMMALLSDEGDPQSFIRHCAGLGLVVEQVAQKKLFYESMVVLKIQRNSEGRRGR